MAEEVTPQEFIKPYSIKSLVCCFSGGRDSLVSTHFILETQGLRHREDLEIHVILIDTTVMIPMTIEYVKEVCARYEWPLTILRPDPDFWTLAEKWGTPGITRRWCCYHLKLKPIFEFVERLPPKRCTVLGLRRDESPRRRNFKQLIYRRKLRTWSYSPILNWSKLEVLRYIEEHSLPDPPHYRLGLSETCLCGAFTHVKELMIMKAVCPEIFQRFIELEKRFGENRSAWFDRRKIFARDLAKQRTLLEVSEEIE
jgi:3'-phosphoadenosine 5'-phosphosulfate sulfotransferase (PAPS reductase)/FAD synthetase